MPSPPSPFRRALSHRNPDPAGRRWLFLPYDQLTDALGPLSREDPTSLGIVVVESLAKARRRPYHRQKLALVLGNLRHFALEQAARGVAVHHRVSSGGYADALRGFLAGLPARARRWEAGSFLLMMEAAEWELRTELAPLVREGALGVVPHEGWLTTEEDFRRGAGRPPWRMDGFYRHVRKRTGILMEAGGPVGGKFSFDAENREFWKGEPPAALPPAFPASPRGSGELEAVTEEVLDLVASRFGDHPGALDAEALPVTLEDAEALWAWAKEACLPHFGPFEDAMSVESRTLFHTRISALMNLHRLVPRRIVEEALALDIPLQGKEGFVRQIVGWREFVRHVHRATEGFRNLPGEEAPGPRPGAGPDSFRSDVDRPSVGAAASDSEADRPPAGATPSFLGASAPLPPAFWGDAPSGLHCLDHVVEGVWEEGYGHHITRLMVLSNLATLLDVSPRALTDWFWVAYVDAFDWVVEPNVLGMGTFAVGDLMTTKPYVSGTPYIRKMSDYCQGCALDPDDTCPISDLYWAFLNRHRDRLAGNRRLALPLASARKRSHEKRESDRRVHQAVQGALGDGGRVTPELVREARKGTV